MAYFVFVFKEYLLLFPVYRDINTITTARVPIVKFFLPE